VGKADFRLYVVVEEGRRRPDAAEQAQAAIEGGATVVQWSGGAGSTRMQVELGRRLAEVARQGGVPLIVGGRVDVTVAVGADGVLLGPEDMPADLARRIVGSDAVVGVLAREPGEVHAAARQGADFVLYTGSVEAVAGSVPIPIVAGQVRHPEEAAQAVQAGAQGVAVTARHIRGGDVGAVCRAFVEALRRAASQAQQFAAGARPLITEPPFGDGRPGFL